MNKISIENAEKLSPQELVELIINNVPFNNIRTCLSNLEKTSVEPEPEKEEMVAPAGPSTDKPVLPTKVINQDLPEDNTIESLRKMCKDDPILIVGTNVSVKNKDEPQVVYYAKSKKDNKFKKFSMDVSKFNLKTCKNLGEPDDAVCKATSEWIDEQLASGKNITEIRKVIDDYLNSGINLYITKCPNFSEIKVKLGMEEPSVVVVDTDENLTNLELSTKYTPRSDYLIYTKDRKEGKFRVAYYDQDKDSWATEDKDRSFLEVIKNSPPVPIDTPMYRLREEAIGRLEAGTPAYKNVSLIVKDLKKNGISLPYSFLNIFA